MDNHASTPRLLLAASLLLAIGACRERSAPRSYVESLRCGMTRAEVTRLAHEHGYNGSDRNWLARAESRQASKELQFVDLTFRAGQLVSYREEVYDPRTKKPTYRTVELCSGKR